ncbi:DUF4031 domain-containing protein (plasmid) [Xanthomonas citri pv. citri]|uniref:DUF4031 domain-containing protein n=1 Tax=Xanthomonas citri TaxID=346 RepID=UPI0019338F7C|nr:DUF4031 domain-containing protein [Xanthomonas citri pv. citri]QRD67029.1 DUF4031 domain-containing protein [Xanthomonas citri pv. citri]QRD71718.1 DUF4031 domain-containing protein [Xanthomonas citri pv. citri]
MTVWVEEALWPRGKFICGHLLADSLTELHAVADALQLTRQYFVGHALVPHYSIPDDKVELAVAAGASRLERRSREAILHRAWIGCARERSAAGCGADPPPRRRGLQSDLFQGPA